MRVLLRRIVVVAISALTAATSAFADPMPKLQPKEIVVTAQKALPWHAP